MKLTNAAATRYTKHTPIKTVGASRFEKPDFVTPRDTNELGLATAGFIMRNIDMSASVSAAKHSGHKIVTASLDRMNFTHPAKLWDLIITKCRLTKVWTSSMEVEVQVNTENVRTGENHEVAHGYLVFVALDDKTLKPASVPPLKLTTPSEKKRAAEADIRRQNRVLEKAQIGHDHLTRIDPYDYPEVVKRTMTTDDSNINHNVFGGVILDMIHQSAERAAGRQANGPVIAVRQDRMSFEQPAFIGEEVKASAVITRTWNTSMEVQVDVTAKDYKTGEERQVASSYLVFVAQDPLTGLPKTVPPFHPKTPKEKQRWEAAEIRRANRMLEKTQMEQTHFE